MNKSFLYLLLLAGSFSFFGCAPLGPSVIKTYSEYSDRSRIAILRADRSRGLTVTGCDGQPVLRGGKYILLQSGRHQINFMILGQTLMSTYTITNKTYIDVEAGHTYILVSKGGGLFVVGDKWFPDLIDVSNDSQLHLTSIPYEQEAR